MAKLLHRYLIISIIDKAFGARLYSSTTDPNGKHAAYLTVLQFKTDSSTVD